MSLNFVNRHVREKRLTKKKLSKRSDRLHNHSSFHTCCVSFANTCCTKRETSEKIDYSTISLLGSNLLPRERTIVAAGHVTSCDNGLLIKSQLTFSFFAAVVISADLSENRNLL